MYIVEIILTIDIVTVMFIQESLNIIAHHLITIDSHLHLTFRRPQLWQLLTTTLHILDGQGRVRLDIRRVRLDIRRVRLDIRRVLIRKKTLIKMFLN